MKRILYLIAGANGSGKTTLARELLGEEKVPFLNADEIAEKIGDGVGVKAGKILLEKLEDIFLAKESFALESTISGKHHLRILKKAFDAKYEIILIYVFLNSVELNVARIKHRVSLGGHDVPESDVRRRFTRSVENFWPAAKLANSWKLYYNGSDSYELVARSEGDVLEVLDDNRYKLFDKMARNGNPR